MNKIFSADNIVPSLKVFPLKYLTAFLEKIIGLSWFNESVNTFCEQHNQFFGDFLSQAIPYLNIKHNISMQNADVIKNHGGKIIVANHEGYLLDALFIIWLLSDSAHRNDFKILTITDLQSEPMLAPYCWFLDKSLGKGRNTSRNAIVFRHMISWLKQGKIIIVFPKNYLEKKKDWSLQKALPWSDLANLLAKAANVPIVPIKLVVPMPAFFKIANSIGLFSYNLHMPFLTKFFDRLTASLGCNQLKFSVGKKISCIVGSEVMPGENPLTGNELRDLVANL